MTDPVATSAKRVNILIVTDAWVPQVNGVVRTLSTITDRVRELGHTVEVIGPDRFRSFALPNYREIRLAYGRIRGRLRKMIQDFAPDAVHIATEGPLGWAARRHCMKFGLSFTTSFHTFFPDYIYMRFRIPRSWSYAVIRRFHRPSSALMVSTDTMRTMLEERGFTNLVIWPRGVDTELFRPRPKELLDHLPRPILMYVGRLAVEKNLDDYFAVKTPGTKVVVGDGPQLNHYKAKHPEAIFVGTKTGEELAQYFAAGDVFVFPSRSETFGLVILEALASGVRWRPTRYRDRRTSSPNPISVLWTKTSIVRCRPH